MLGSGKGEWDQKEAMEEMEDEDEWVRFESWDSSTTKLDVVGSNSGNGYLVASPMSRNY